MSPGFDAWRRGCRGNFAQFEEMYEQKRTEVNKSAEKFEKEMKAAKRSGNKANQVGPACAHPPARLPIRLPDALLAAQLCESALHTLRFDFDFRGTGKVGPKTLKAICVKP